MQKEFLYTYSRRKKACVHASKLDSRNFFRAEYFLKNTFLTILIEIYFLRDIIEAA